MLTETLFSEGRDPQGDAALLLEITDALLYGDDPMRAQMSLMQIGVRSAPALRERLQGRQLPPVTLEVLGAASLLCLPKDYNAHACLEAMLSLVDGLPGPHPPRSLPPPDPEDVGQRYRNEVRTFAFRLWLGGLARGADREVDPYEREIALLAVSLMPLCAGGQSIGELRTHRSWLVSGEGASRAWTALRAAFDAVGAGSLAALDELTSLADADPTSPSLLWLAEYACRLAGRDSPADALASRLDTLLASDAFGPNARALTRPMVNMSRTSLFNDKNDPRAAWARLEEYRLEPDSDPGEDLEDLERRFRTHPELARVLRVIKALDEQPDCHHEMASLNGPFERLHPPQDVRLALNGASHYLLMSYRQLRGLETLAPGAQRLARLLSAGTS